LLRDTRIGYGTIIPQFSYVALMATPVILDFSTSSSSEGKGVEVGQSLDPCP